MTAMMHRIEEEGTGRQLTSFIGQAPRRGDSFVFGRARWRVADVEWRPVVTDPSGPGPTLIAVVYVAKWDV